jgi:hypothetical protein
MHVYNLTFQSTLILGGRERGDEGGGEGEEDVK